MLAAAEELTGARDSLTIVLDAICKDCETMGPTAIRDTNARAHLERVDPALPTPSAEAYAASKTYGYLKEADDLEPDHDSDYDSSDEDVPR